MIVIIGLFQDIPIAITVRAASEILYGRGCSEWVSLILFKMLVLSNLLSALYNRQLSV